MVATFAKLMLRLRALGADSADLNRSAAEAMLVGAAILRLGNSAAIAHAIDDDSRDRIVTSLRVIPPSSGCPPVRPLANSASFYDPLEIIIRAIIADSLQYKRDTCSDLNPTMDGYLKSRRYYR